MTINTCIKKLPKLFYVCFLSAMLVFESSCGRPGCTNTNTTFEKFMPGTNEYKSELAKQIQSIGSGNLSYWFDNYLMKDGKEFILVDIQGDALCAKGEIQVFDWNKIGGLRNEKNGYRGSELKGLKIDTRQDSSGTSLIFQDIAGIVD